MAAKQKSSEELEMERIKQLKKELQHKRQMAQESYKKAMSKAVPVAAHAKDLTVPQAFNFHTDKRLKTQGEKNEERSVGDFVKSLRSRTVVSPVGRVFDFRISVNEINVYWGCVCCVVRSLVLDITKISLTLNCLFTP